jgi:hypothetical protein
LFGNCTSDFSFPPPILSWYINSQKADASLLQPSQETTFDAYGFKLYQRSLEIRFRIDNKINPFIIDNKIHMKCVAQLPKMPSQIREKNHILFVSSWDDLRNQKLINWRNSGELLSIASSLHFHFHSLLACGYAIKIDSCTLKKILNIYIFLI